MSSCKIAKTLFLSAVPSLDVHHDVQDHAETILKVGDHDVIFGRGGKSFCHPGNRLFRRLVFHNKELYETCRNSVHRQIVALSIVNAIQRTGGKFLRKDEAQTSASREAWTTVSVKEACVKTSQALRDASVRYKKCSAGKKSDNKSLKIATVDHTVSSSSATVSEETKSVVSPCSDSPVLIENSVSLPPIPILSEPTCSNTGEDLDEIDHIDLETIQTLVRSLASFNGQNQQSSSHSQPRRSIQRSNVAPRLSPSSTWHCQQKEQNRPVAIEPTTCTNHRLSFTVNDWLSKQIAQENDLVPAPLKAPFEQYPPRHQHAAGTRSSVTSLSMLESSLFSTDFEIDLEEDEIFPIA